MADKKDLKVKKDLAGDKLMAVIVAAFAGLFVLMLLYRGYDNPHAGMFMYVFVLVLAIVFTLLFAASLVWLIMSKKKNRNYSDNVITPVNTAVTMFAAAACCWIMHLFGMFTIKAMYFIIPAYVVLYMIETIFDRDFLSLGVYLVAAGFGSYILNRKYIETSVPASAVVWIVIFALVSAAYIAMIFTCKKRGGKLLMGKLRLMEVKRQGSYGVMTVAPAVYIALCIMRFFAAYAFRIGVYFAIAYIIVGFIYYTLSMLKK